MGTSYTYSFNTRGVTCGYDERRERERSEREAIEKRERSEREAREKRKNRGTDRNEREEKRLTLYCGMVIWVYCGL